MRKMTLFIRYVWLSIGIILFLICASCEKFQKGNMSGDVSYVSEVLENKSANIREETYSNIPHLTIMILKYSDDLTTKHDQLKNECFILLQEPKKKYDINFDNNLSLYRLDPESAHARAKAITFEYNKEVNFIMRDCNNKCRNLIFPYILHQIKTDQNGHYEFKQLSYGKYYVSAQFSSDWWLVPVYINKDEIRMDLSPRNAFSLGGLLH